MKDGENGKPWIVLDYKDRHRSLTVKIGNSLGRQKTVTISKTPTMESLKNRFTRLLGRILTQEAIGELLSWIE